MEKTSLLVLIRGWSHSGRLPPDFVATLAENLPEAEIWLPELEMDTFSLRDAESLSQELCAKLDARVGPMPGLKRIVLLGYSAGSLLARRLFCLANGMTMSGTLDETLRKPWAALIERQVVLAGITRGWELSSAAPVLTRFFYPLLTQAARGIAFLSRPFRNGESKELLIDQLRRGAPFVIATRIQYIRLLNRLATSVAEQTDSGLQHGGMTTTVFLLGARDEFVSPVDCTELGARQEFAYVELPGSSHTEALQISPAPAEAPAGEKQMRDERRTHLLAALRLPFLELRREDWCVPLADIDDYLDPMDLAANPEDRQAQNERVKHVVMILHGIRDNGFWTKRVAREIKTLGRRQGCEVRVATPSYGFFSMWDFINLGGRRKATYWFMERYADVVSHFPNATEICFVGHSNGTYLAARALALCPAIRFERMVFAGSVVRRDFPWAEFVDNGQVNHVLNYIGSKDSVVAFLPGGLERLKLRLFNVGGAGAFGFVPPLARLGRSFAELRFVKGGHSAAVQEDRWREIAAYVLSGATRLPPPATRSPLCRRIFHIAPLVTLLLVLLVTLIFLSPLLVFSWNWLVPSLNEWLEMLRIPDDGWGPLRPFSCIQTALSAQMLSLAVAYATFRILRRW